MIGHINHGTKKRPCFLFFSINKKTFVATGAKLHTVTNNIIIRDAQNTDLAKTKKKKKSTIYKIYIHDAL